MDKGMLYCELFESFGPKILPIFQPYVLKFTASSEECQQRWASEMVFGLIKGTCIFFLKNRSCDLFSPLWAYVPENGSQV